MKINNLSINNNRNRGERKTNFKGANPMVAFWDAIDRGGTTANFLVQDLASGGIRSGLELNRDKEKTGKLNFIAAGESAIREFTTSPAMFLVPTIAMGGLAHVFGKANDVKLNQILDFSQIAKATVDKFGYEAAKSKPEEFKAAFLNDVMDSIKKSNLGDTDLTPFQDELDKIMQNVTKLNSGVKGKEKKRLISEVETSFADIVKRTSKDYYRDFSSVKLSNSANAKPSRITTIFSNANLYFEDFSKKMAKNKDGFDSTKFFETFTNNRIAGRLLTGVVVTALMILTMFNLPKLYQLGGKKPPRHPHHKPEHEPIKPKSEVDHVG